jgi:hypothetical protein
LKTIINDMTEKLGKDGKDALSRYLSQERVDVASFCAGTDNTRLIMEERRRTQLCVGW